MSHPNPFSVSTLGTGLKELCGTSKTQSGKHIKPIHRHLSERLVLEGGFPPEWLLPSPPLSSKRIKSKDCLQYEPSASDHAERSVLGGIKSKNVDVTVFEPGIGPALGISAKSTGNAFRNLTNRMEEALGDCANIHMMYPGFVFGFLHFIKFASLDRVAPPDASFDANGKPLEKLVRYHDVLVSLSGRTTITDPAMRYESVGLIVVCCDGDGARVLPDYPPTSSPVHFSKFFRRLYEIFDLRFAYPDSTARNRRRSWCLPNLAVPCRHDLATGFPWEVRLEEDAES